MNHRWAERHSDDSSVWLQGSDGCQATFRSGDVATPPRRCAGSGDGGASYARSTVRSSRAPYRRPSVAFTAATSTMLTTTSSDHDPTLAGWTSVHTDAWDG